LFDFTSVFLTYRGPDWVPEGQTAVARKPAEEGLSAGAEGFTAGSGRNGGFRDSPVKSLEVLLTKIRQNCETIEKTHLRKILDGVILEEANFGSIYVDTDHVNHKLLNISRVVFD
jgi:hypothetical protein